MLILEEMMIGDNNGQKIDAGNNSQNTQIGGNLVICNGLTYNEVKQIANDVYEKNMIEFQKEAKREADKRANEITQVLLNKINEQFSNEKIGEIIKLFYEPSIQYALYNLQKSHVLRNSSEIKDMLVTTMIERLSKNGNEQYEVIYDEALKTLSLLTKEHVVILAIILLVKHTAYNNRQSFDEFLNIIISLFEECPNCKKDLMYEHLIYAGCIVDKSPYSALTIDWVRHFHDILGLKENVSDETLNKFIQNNYNLKRFALLWDDKWMKSVNLTSVGKVLAVTYLKNKNIPIDYGIWIN